MLFLKHRPIPLNSYVNSYTYDMAASGSGIGSGSYSHSRAFLLCVGILALHAKAAVMVDPSMRSFGVAIKSGACKDGVLLLSFIPARN